MRTKSYNAFIWLHVIAMLLILSFPSMASWSQRQKITSTPRGVGAQFGNAVAINGNTMVVGARFDSTTASQAGAAYVYVLNAGAWTQQAVLLAPDGAATDKFGYSVAIGQDTVIVGSYNDDSPLSNAGSAYVFVRSGTVFAHVQEPEGGYQASSAQVSGPRRIDRIQILPRDRHDGNPSRETVRLPGVQGAREKEIDIHDLPFMISAPSGASYW